MSWTGDFSQIYGDPRKTNTDPTISPFINPAPIGGRGLPPYDYPSPTAPSSPPSLPPAPSPIDPAQYAATLYGKDIPKIIASRVQVGGRIIEGPILTKIGGINAVSMVVAYYQPVNYWDTTTRTVTELWFRGKQSWSLAGGSTMSGLNVGVPTSGTNQTVRFNIGTVGQNPDAWSVSRFGGDALNYGPLVTATFENIRIDQFENLIPFTSVTVEDTAYATPGEQIPWSDILESLARDDGRSTADFETVDVTDGVVGLILGQKVYFPELLAALRKLKPYWHLLTKDKLYVVEKGPYSLDTEIERAKVEARGPDPITFHHDEQADKNRKLTFTYIDLERDYELVPVEAERELDPVPETDAYSDETVNTPLISTMQPMIASAYLALFQEEMAREQSEFTGLLDYLGLEPGDSIKITTDDKSYYHTLREVVRHPNYTTDAKAVGFLTCHIESDVEGAGFLVVGGSEGSIVLDDNSVVETSADGSTWDAQTTGFEATFFGVATNGSTIVAVGVDITALGPATREPKISTSANAGVSWNARTPPIITEGVLHDVVYSSTDNQFVCVGVDDDSGTIASFPHFGLVGTSAAGTSWTQRTLSADEYELFGICENGGTYVTFGRDWDATLDAAIFRSTNAAVTWAKQTAPAEIVGKAGWLNAGAWSGERFILVGFNDDDEEGVIIASDDGQAPWTLLATIPGIELTDIHSDGSKCVVVGRSSTAFVPYITTSDDHGDTWTPRTPDPATGIALESVTKSGAIWCAVGGAGTTPAIMTSVGASSWTARTADPSTNAFLFGVVALG